jgi:deoxyhypusine synthase/S-adenosylmethionine/arginine decarboxylase-like enzyme
MLVEQVLNAYPDTIGMTKIGGPYMFEYQAPDPAYSGVSGLVVIAESHIALHTFPELDYFTMDIFSCKNFDHEKAIEYIRDAFDVKEMDRMLVQRGLSFKGPHHGKDGATDELIAAAQARLAAGIVSKEPAIPDMPPAALGGERKAALARRAEQANTANESSGANGQMIWPQYGVTPDLGSADKAVDCAPCARGGARVVSLSAHEAPLGTDGKPLSAMEPVQVNPTASVSGLLDKMAATGRQGRALGWALAEWKQLARDSESTIALALSEPLIAAGMRQTLVYAVDHRYVDVVIACADDLYADLYEALGYAHYDDGDEMVALAEGRAATDALFLDLLAAMDLATVTNSADLWKQIGDLLPTRTPRKGLIQAAAAVGAPIFTPDLALSAFGSVLVTARAKGIKLRLDATDDVEALARLLGAWPRLGALRLGAGLADATLMQAWALTTSVGLETPTLSSSVALGAPAIGSGEHAISVQADATLALPLLVTGLAQRIPGARHRQPAPVARAARKTEERQPAALGR